MKRKKKQTFWVSSPLPACCMSAEPNLSLNFIKSKIPGSDRGPQSSAVTRCRLNYIRLGGRSIFLLSPEASCITLNLGAEDHVKPCQASEHERLSVCWRGWRMRMESRWRCLHHRQDKWCTDRRHSTLLPDSVRFQLQQLDPGRSQSWPLSDLRLKNIYI